MTHATHTTIPSLQQWRRVIAAVAVTATIIAVTAVAQQRDDGTSATARAAGPATTVLAAPEEVSAYARSHGLTGLSPASLTRHDGTADASADEVVVYEVYRDVARYADAHGLTGLSPASLAPALGPAADRTDSCAQRLAQAWRDRPHLSRPYNTYLLRQLPGCP